MRRLSGQAARHLARTLHRLARLAMIAAVLVVVAVAGLSWRLAQGPLEVPALTRFVQHRIAAEAGSLDIRIGHAALAWEGFRLGVDTPLDIRLSDVVIGDPARMQQVRVPQANVSLSIEALLLGHIRPRAVVLDGLALDLLRLPDGSIRIGAAPGVRADTVEPMAVSPLPGQARPAAGAPEPPLLNRLLAELASPPTDDRSHARFPPPLLSQMRHLAIRNALITLLDQRLGAIWTAPHASLTIDRLAHGGLHGSGHLVLAVAGAQTTLDFTAAMPPGGAAPIAVTAQLGAISPARLAVGAVHLGALAAVDAPVSARIALSLTPALRIARFHLDATASPGALHLGGAVIGLAGASLTASGDPAAINIGGLDLRLSGNAADAHAVLHLSGTLDRDTAAGTPEAEAATQPGWHAALQIGIARVDFAALPALWPPSIAGNARAWITTNITHGIGENGTAAITLATGPDFTAPRLTGASATLAAHALVVHWLRPVPPLIDASATLHWRRPDSLRIDIGRAIQRSPQGTPTSLAITAGSVHITGLTAHDQVATIKGQLAGSVADAIALLSHPRLHLLSDHPFPLHDPAGSFTGTLGLTVPLENAVKMEDIAISAEARLQALHLGRLVGGRDLDDGNATLQADANGLHIAGTARLGGLASTLSAEIDFRAGPPSQVLEHVRAEAEASPASLAAAGIDTAGVLRAGTVALRADLTERRNGDGQLDIDAGLGHAVLALAPLGWEKAAGIPAKAKARLLLAHDRMIALSALSLQGSSIAVEGKARFAQGRLTRLDLSRFDLGQTRAHGDVEFPAQPGAPLTLHLSGPMIDLSARLAHQHQETAKPAKKASQGPALAVDATFAQARMAHGVMVRDLALMLRDDGTRTQALSLSGRLPPDTPFSLRIARTGGVRRLSADTADAGGLLRALDVTSSMQGGHLTITGQYDDAASPPSLNGDATIEDFRIRGAPALGRLLQAMTLYGLVDVVSGPGLAFHRLIAPFSLGGDILALHDARAFSASLGLTAKGTLDLATRQADLAGTIVPAYFFNTLLGHIPLLGRLFSPEQGGGLFAASYAITGPLDDPKVSVNPLAALTPGVLRGLFGLF